MSAFTGALESWKSKPVTQTGSHHLQYPAIIIFTLNNEDLFFVLIYSFKAYIVSAVQILTNSTGKPCSYVVVHHIV